MLVDLDKKGLISLVCGCEPSYEQMEHRMCKDNGTFSGSYGRWDWNWDAFQNNTEDEIYAFYIYLRKSK